MSETKFTKGEWFIEKDASWNNDCWAISVKRDCDDSIHHCFAEVTCKMEYEDHNEELEANAYLIACSPELYGDIEKDLKFLDAVLGELTVGSPIYFSVLSRIEVKNTLLAKAKGVSND